MEEEAADWGMKREEANNRREVGRGGRRKGKKTAEDGGKTRDLSINYKGNSNYTHTQHNEGVAAI